MNSFYLEFSSSFFLVLKIFISLFFVFCCFFTEGGGGYFCLVFHWPVSFFDFDVGECV